MGLKKPANGDRLLDNREYLFEQVARARESLGNALGLTQNIRLQGLDLNRVSIPLAGAVKALFQAEQEGLTSPVSIDDAMFHLRITLTHLQEVIDSDPTLEAATETVAKTLAILFPVFKALSISLPAEQEPIPLVPSPPSHPPLPLVKKSATEERLAADRRVQERRSIEVDIGFQSEANFYTGFSMDISSGGLFVATYDIPPIGTHVNVNFRLPSGPMMSLDGLVRWVREYSELNSEIAPGIGVMFENLHPKEEALINQYLERSSPLFFEE